MLPRMFNRWEEVLKRLRLDLSIQELGENGEYEAVEITRKAEVPCVGVFQLKQVSAIL